MGTAEYLETGNRWTAIYSGPSGTDQLGAQVSPVPPDHLVFASIGSAAGQRQQELVRDFGPKDVEAQAAVGHVGDQAKLPWTATERLRIAAIGAEGWFSNACAGPPWLTGSGAMKLGHLAIGLIGAREFSAVLAKELGPTYVEPERTGLGGKTRRLPVREVEPEIQCRRLPRLTTFAYLGPGSACAEATDDIEADAQRPSFGVCVAQK